jgi:hypothetical protein
MVTHYVGVLVAASTKYSVHRRFLPVPDLSRGLGEKRAQKLVFAPSEMAAKRLMRQFS